MKAARRPEASKASGGRFGTSPKTADQRLSDKTAALLIAQAQQAFGKAAKAAVAENDRLGIATHGAVGGKLVVRRPQRDSAE